jgi:dUTP pyrophosphatase
VTGAEEVYDPRMLRVPVHQLDPDLPVPSYARRGDAGADLYAREGAKLAAGGGRALVPTGLVVAIPPGYAGFVQPRSGLALKHGVTCLNTPGLIDAGYRGELSVLLVNTDPETAYEVARGDRIAQLVIQEVAVAGFAPTARNELPPSERGDAGFGHSGR